MKASSKPRLEDVVAYFEESLDWEFEIEEFDERLRMQKLVYFAKECGLEVPYNYNIYRYGPYSPDLAEDYYELSGSGDSLEGSKGLDKATFEELVDDHSNRWLELAATIHKIKSKYEHANPSHTRAKVIERVSNMKEVSESRVEAIYEELSEYPLDI